MNRTARLATKLSTAIAGGLALIGLAALPVSAQVAAPLPFEESAYLYNTAFDTSIYGHAGQGTGAWAAYKSWLGGPALGAEGDPGWDNLDWYDCCQRVSYNDGWGQMQATHPELTDVILGIGQMPRQSGYYSPNQDLAFEDSLWQKEAANDPTLMSYFAGYAKDVDNLGFKSVIIRLGYEFDGFWDPYGNLDKMTNMPYNYQAAWKNIVNAMRAADTKHVIRGFLWNPTDSNVRVNSFSFYPGDDCVDFIGMDTYDVAYGGTGNHGYPVGTNQPSQAVRDDVWYNSELPRIQKFADFASSSATRPLSTAGAYKPLIVGEWGTWQLNDGNHPSGGDNDSYIQRMHNWMADPSNHVYMESYFEAPADGNSSLSGIFGATTFPKAAAKYRDLFGTSYSYGGAAAAVPGTVQAVNYDTGGQGIAYNQTVNGGQTGSRSDNSSADYGTGLGWASQGQWYKYTVNVASPGTYAVACRVNAPTGGTFHLEDKSGANLTGPITCPSTGNWNTVGTATATVSLPAGLQVLKWVQDSTGFNWISMTFSAPGGGGAPVGHRIGIKSSASGLFASVDLYANDPNLNYLEAAFASSVQNWERFDVVDTGNGNIALKCEQTGKYVSVDMNQSSRVLRADWATTPDTWEAFQWVNQGGGVFALKAGIDGLYVSCDLNAGDRLEAQWASTVGSWEQFTYTDLGTY